MDLRGFSHQPRDATQTSLSDPRRRTVSGADNDIGREECTEISTEAQYSAADECGVREC